MIRLSPESPKIKEFVTISVADSFILVKTQTINRDVNGVLKHYGYQFSYQKMAWWHKPSPQLVSLLDGAAEIATHLLTAGFLIESTPGVIDLVMSGNFEPECRRWVKAYEGRFAICWNKPEDCYRLALTLPSARYAPPFIAVPGQYYDEVMDFADVYQFRVLDSAKKLEIDETAKRRSVIFFTPLQKTVRPDVKVDEFGIPDELKDTTL